MSLTIAVSTQRQILAFWLPLAASWALMSAEGPILQAVIARLPELQTQLAAFGIVMSLEIAIESPVIMLLATSTALSTNAGNYLTVRRFMIWVNILATVVAAVVAFTPLYKVLVSGMMGIPPRIAAAAQPGMRIMTLWSAAIGWRRFYQGVLIRQGQTGWVGYGTLARLVSSAGAGIGLAILTSLPGVHIASIGLMAGVVVEAVFITHAVQPTVRKLLREGHSRSKTRGGKDDAVSLRYVARYHAPLAATSLLTLLAQPLIGAGLARMPFPEENLAAWPVVWGILFLFRSPAFALPEAVIALVSESRPAHPLRAFCWRVGWGSSLAMVALACTPLLRLYLRYLAGLPEHLSRFVVPGLLLGIIIPFINAVHSWFRGLLMAARSTKEIYWGMGLNLAVTALVMLLAVLLSAPGVAAGVIAITVAFLVEIEFLRRKTGQEFENPRNPRNRRISHSLNSSDSLDSSDSFS